MTSPFFKTIRNSIKHWYLPMLAGIIFIVIGIYTLMQPLQAYAALSYIFSISFLISGIFEIAFSITNRNEIDNWGWLLAFGIINVLIGLLLLANLELSMITLSLYAGFLILFRSIAAISYSIDLKNFGIRHWGYLLALGIIGIFFSLMMIFNPIFGGINIVIWTGTALLISGIYSIYLSFKLKKLKDMPDKVPQELKDRLHAIQTEIRGYSNA